MSRVGAAVVGVVLLAGCSGGTGLPTAPPVVPPTVGAVKDLPTADGDFRAVCSGAAYRDAAAYPGTAPHLAQFITVDPDSMPVDPLPNVPPEWVTGNVAAVQLVACITTRRGALIRTCDYSAGHAALYWRNYGIAVRETRTGRQVGRTTVVRGAQNRCATSVTDPTEAQYTTLTLAQLRMVVGRYVEGAG